jgi:hypothetical protein
VGAREIRFRQAAIAYLVYGILYLGGAVYLVGQGMGVRGMAGGRPGVVWFVLGTLFVVVFPWLIAKGPEGRGYLWFTRILTLLVAYRAFEVARVALSPKAAAVPLPGGGEVSMATGAGLFLLVTLGTMVMLARAAWSRDP